MAAPRWIINKVRGLLQAAKLNNPDAIARLQALSTNAAPMSMAEHQTRLNDTLVRKRTDAKMRSDRMGVRQRRGRDEERVRNEADKAARKAASSGGTNPGQHLGGHTGPGMAGRTISPAPRVGDIMSPSTRPVHIMSPGISPANYPAISPSGSFPRPPIPHQAWNGFPDASQTNSGERRGSGYSLQDPGMRGEPNTGQAMSADEDRRRAEVERRKKEKEPKTFAEMGFQSKPVEDEGCVVM